MNNLSKCFTLVLLFFLYQVLSADVIFADNSVGSSFRFLLIGAGARPAGMGETFVAMADDVNSIYWNPAGLASVRSRQITSSYLQYVVDVNSGYLGYAMPAFNGGIGLGVIYMDYGSINESTIDNPAGTLDSYRPYDIALIASYGRKINKKLNAGVSLKGIYENIKGYTANAVALDAGLIYKMPVKNLKLGFALKNVGQQTKAFVEEIRNLPLTFDLGLAYSVLSNKIRFAANCYSIDNNTIGVNGGIEYEWKKMICARFGFQTKGQDLKTGSSSDAITGFTTGMGVNLRDMKIDYAFVPFNELGYVQRVSVSINFGRKK